MREDLAPPRHGRVRVLCKDGFGFQSSSIDNLLEFFFATSRVDDNTVSSIVRDQIAVFLPPAVHDLDCVGIDLKNLDIQTRNPPRNGLSAYRRAVSSRKKFTTFRISSIFARDLWEAC